MNQLKSLRKFCTTKEAEEYPKAMKILHWGMAIGLAGTIGFVKLA